jgi:hypothetical protein
MKPEKRIEKFLRRIDVIPDAERKRLRLEELLEARDKTKKPTSVVSKPTIRRIIMNRKIWKIAASLMVANRCCHAGQKFLSHPDLLQFTYETC